MIDSAREQALDELIRNADLIRELEFKRLELQQELRVLVDEYREIDYKHLMDVESAGDARSRELYSDGYRKDKEVEHRLRTDRRAREIKTKYDHFETEIKKIEAEIHALDEKKTPLERIAGISLPQVIKNRLRHIARASEREDEED